VGTCFCLLQWGSSSSLECTALLLQPTLCLADRRLCVLLCCISRARNFVQIIASVAARARVVLLVSPSIQQHSFLSLDPGQQLCCWVWLPICMGGYGTVRRCDLKSEQHLCGAA
jgi:hypothetical protein